MRVQNSPQDPCPICGKDITLAVTEPHPTHPRKGAPYISVCGLRTGQNYVPSATRRELAASGLKEQQGEKRMCDGQH